MTLEQIRVNIEKDSVGMLYFDDIAATMKAIESFKSAHHYLPNDLDEWYNMTYESFLEQQEEQAFQQQAYEEYRELTWESYFKD